MRDETDGGRQGPLPPIQPASHFHQGADNTRDQALIVEALAFRILRKGLKGRVALGQGMVRWVRCVKGREGRG